MSQSLESYLDICVQTSDNPDYGVQYVLAKRHVELAQKLVKLTDDELGDWMVSEYDTSRRAEDAVRIVGPKRIEAALKDMCIEDMQRLLVDASRTFLEETQGEVDVEMPEELKGIKDDEKLAYTIWLYGNDKAAKALLVLSNEGKLHDFLMKQIVSSFEVSIYLVNFYEAIMEA